MQNIILNKPIKYKELAKMFELEFKEGGSRKRQLEKLCREYNIIKYGTHYVITGELGELDKIENKPKLKFQDYIVPLLYTYMHNGMYRDTVVKSKGNILKDLAMINDKFFAVREDPYLYALSFDENLDGEDLLKYTEEAYKVFSFALNSAVAEINDRKLAFVEKIKLTLIEYPPNKEGKILKKSIELTNEQKGLLNKTQDEFLLEHGLEKWSQIPYVRLKYANDWVEKKVGFKSFDGYRFIINEGGIERYISSNWSEMKIALSNLVSYKISNSNRKNICNISKETRLILAHELHRELPKKKKEEY